MKIFTYETHPGVLAERRSFGGDGLDAVEAGGQPISGAPGPVAEPIRSGYPDLPQNSFYEYGVREGIARMLNLFDKHEVKVTSFMIGEAVDKYPELAAEIVRRGHEAAAHGRRWENQYLLEPDEEREWV